MKSSIFSFATQTGVDTPRWNAIIFWCLISVVFIIIPGFIFDGVIAYLALQYGEEVKRFHVQKASELYSAVENDFQVAPAIQRILRHMQRTAAIKLLSDKEAKRLQDQLKKKLPVNSRFYWFDNNCRLIAAPPNTTGNRVWQSLAKVVTKHPTANANDERFAIGLQKTLFSSLVPPNYLGGGVNQVIEILYETLPYYFSLVPLRADPASDSAIVGYCFAFIPRRISSRDWELKRAMKRHTRPDRWVGGYRFSTEKAYQVGSLGENLLVGLSTRFRQGETEMQLGRDLYLVRSRPEDPDLMIVVGIRMPLFPDYLLPSILQWLRFFVWLVLTALTWKCVQIGSGAEHVPLTLSAKFKIGTALLAGLPIVVILFQVISQANIIHKAEHSVYIQRLELLLTILEQGVTSRVLGVQNGLLKLMSEPEIKSGIEINLLEKKLREVSYVSYLQYIYLHVSGKHYLRSSEDDTMNSRIQLRLILTALSSTDFQFPLHLISSSTASLTGSLATLNMSKEQLDSILDRLEPQQLGNRDYYMFSSFAYDAYGTKTAFLNLAIPFIPLRDRFLEETRKQIVEDHHDASVFFEGEMTPFSQINPFLEATGDSERTFRAIIRHGQNSYLALGRPLRGLRKRALVLYPMRAGISTSLAYSQMFIIVALALIAAVITASHLIKVFLDPVRSLLTAVRAVDKGDFAVSLTYEAHDELGRLMNRFNKMAEGLSERSRMSSFVRSDLLAVDGQTMIQYAERRSLTVLFAGIRDFSRLESALDPENAMQTMSRFLELCSQAVKEAEGQIDKFIGETAMAIFLSDDTAHITSFDKAVYAATRIYYLVHLWNIERQNGGSNPIKCGIGIAHGQAITGSIGSKRKRLDFTAIGDTVNLAARLEKIAARGEAAPILAAGLKPHDAPVGWVWHRQQLGRIRGKTEHVEIYGLTTTTHL